MFAEISADVYIMVDGDGTYDASAAPQLVGMIINDRVDMAIGVRANVRENAHRAGHALGNRLFNSVYKALFGYAFGDMLSGYRNFFQALREKFSGALVRVRDRDGIVGACDAIALADRGNRLALPASARRAPHRNCAASATAGGYCARLSTS
jgi:hypothetical protein